MLKCERVVTYLKYTLHNFTKMKLFTYFGLTVNGAAVIQDDSCLADYKPPTSGNWGFGETFFDLIMKLLVTSIINDS